jgi:hypothetical protein
VQHPLNPESMLSLASQESALRPLLIFRYRWTTQKIAAGDVLKFLGKLTYPEKVPFDTACTNKFFIVERYQEFCVRVEIAYAFTT